MNKEDIENLISWFTYDLVRMVTESDYDNLYEKIRVIINDIIEYEYKNQYLMIIIQIINNLNIIRNNDYFYKTVSEIYDDLSGNLN